MATMRIYFLGICGAAMGNVALLMRSLGHDVVGADSGIYPPMSDTLLRNQIKLYEGYDVKRLQQINPDLVVVGNAMTRGNPEIEYLLDTYHYPFISMSELLNREVLKNRKSIVVTGTHGKTTTTTLIAYLLHQAEIDAGYMIGGIPRDFNQGAHLGNQSAPFVIEGDEYDTAFFDKRSKFIHYKPDILIINNIEFDHADIFKDIEDIKRNFSHLLKIVPRSGHILVNGDDPVVLEITKNAPCRVIKIGFGAHNDVQIRDFSENTTNSTFQIFDKETLLTAVQCKLNGHYNARNIAMACVATKLCLRNKAELPWRSLANFLGVKRRQEILFSGQHLLVMEDFGHHPTAVKEVLTSLRNKYPDYKLIACFEPRSNTAAINVHEQEMIHALSLADESLIAPIHRAETIPEDKRLNVTTITQSLPNCQAFSDFENLHKALEDISERSELQVICFFSNGALGGILPKWVKGLSKQAIVA